MLCGCQENISMFQDIVGCLGGGRGGLWGPSVLILSLVPGESSILVWWGGGVLLFGISINFSFSVQNYLFFLTKNVQGDSWVGIWITLLLGVLKIFPYWGGILVLRHNNFSRHCLLELSHASVFLKASFHRHTLEIWWRRGSHQNLGHWRTS